MWIDPGNTGSESGIHPEYSHPYSRVKFIQSIYWHVDEPQADTWVEHVKLQRGSNPSSGSNRVVSRWDWITLFHSSCRWWVWWFEYPGTWTVGLSYFIWYSNKPFCQHFTASLKLWRLTRLPEYQSCSHAISQSQGSIKIVQLQNKSITLMFTSDIGTSEEEASSLTINPSSSLAHKTLALSSSSQPVHIAEI